MADAPYLVCLALVDKDGLRSMPLNGKSMSASAAPAADPGEAGLSLALELLLRLWQASDGAPLQRAAAADSLLLVELPLELMSERLPLLKAAWLASGDTGQFLAGLRSVALRGWRVAVAKYEPISFSPFD